MNWKLITILFIASILFVAACGNQNPSGDDCENCPASDDKISGDFKPTPYKLQVPSWLSQPIIPADNPMTVEGVALGRRLFYDPILSMNGQMSCGTCHQQSKAFTDGNAFSLGVRGLPSKRNTMSIVNLAFNANGFFWDGRVATLEEQAIFPVEDHLEMNEDWANVEKKLQKHSDYPSLFRSAFGIEKKSELTKNLVVKAIAQFERTLISTNSRFDRILQLNDGFLEDEEERGRRLFFFEPNDIMHPGCSHCHFNPFYTDNNYHNNGLDSVANLDSFRDAGRGAVTNNRFDNGKFRTPTLRNIELTAPYMHDGRFKTLEEVLENYSKGGHNMENENANIAPFTLTEQNKRDMIAFLKTLTDTSFVKNPAFSNPFK